MDKRTQQLSILAAMSGGTPLAHACQAEGMPSRQTVYEWAWNDEGGFGKELQEARQKLYGTLQDEHDRLTNLVTTAAKDQVPGLQTALRSLEWKMEKRLRGLYGAQPATLVQNNVLNVVCDEATRASLIEQRERLLSGRATKDAATGRTGARNGIVEGELVS